MEGKRCPLFGQQKHTMIDIEGPAQMDHFSVQFAFDHGRFVTPWLHLVGNKRVHIPFIHVELVKTGTALTGVHAQVLEYDPKTHHIDGNVRIYHSQDYLGKVYNDFHDPTKWPKHVFVKYTWKTRHETDVEFALLTLISISVLSMIVVGVRSMAAYRAHIERFFMEKVMEEPVAKRQVHPQYAQHHVAAPHVGRPWTQPVNQPIYGEKAD